MRRNNNTANNSSNKRDNKNTIVNSDSNSMEQSFYEDNTQFSNNNNNNNNTSNNNNNNSMKRPLSLDLNTKTPPKKQRLTQPSTGAEATAASAVATAAANTPLVIDSPDLQVLKFNTPDIEKFILANTSLQTPTPNIVFPTKVTSEQEDYAKGFEDALNSLRNSENSQNLSINTTSSSVVSGMSGGSITYTNLDEMSVAIKDEPQTVPNSPPLSPIDMEDQERIKLERKRQRNRVAASKCRKRKLERISKLEDKVKSLKGENAELASLIKKLKEHVCILKQKVMEHVHAGCSLISSNNILQVK